MKWVKISRISGLMLNVIPKEILKFIIIKFKLFQYIEETKNTQVPVTFDHWYVQQVKRHCQQVYWPVHPTSTVVCPEKIYCGIETSPGYMPGSYIQGYGGIYVGDYTQIGPNVGLISSNHSLNDNRKAEFSVVRIGKYCWIGMGVIILPGVDLGDHTIVAAGAVVTKSFPLGYCVLGGNPARIIKSLDKDRCIKHQSEFEYNGYISSKDFENYRAKYLDI